MREIYDAVRKAQFNIGLKRLVKYVCLALLYGSLACLLMALISLFVPVLHVSRITGTIFASAVIAGLAICLLKWPGKKEAAIKLDATGLKERVHTALENEGKTDIFSVLQREETVKVLSRTDINKSLKAPVNLYIPIAAVMLFIISAVIFTLPTLSHTKAARMEALKNEKSELAKEEKESEKIAEALDRAYKEIADAKSAKEIADVEKRLEKKKAEARKNGTSDHSENKEGAGLGNLSEGTKKAEGEGENGGDDPTKTHGAKQGEGGEETEGNEGSYANGSEGGNGNTGGSNASGTGRSGNHSENGKSGEGGNGQNGKSGQGEGNGQGNGSEGGEGKGNGKGNGSGEGEGGGKGQGEGNGGGSGNGEGGGYNRGSENGVQRNDINKEAESIIIPGETYDAGNLSGTLTDGDTYETGQKIMGQGTEGRGVAYDSVVGEYRDKAATRIDNGSIDYKYKDLIKNYFSGLSK